MFYSAFHLKNKEKNQGQTRQTQGCSQEQQVHMFHSESCSGANQRCQRSLCCRPQARDARSEAPGSSSRSACLLGHVTLQIWGLTEMQPALSLGGGDYVPQDWKPGERRDKERASGLPGLRLRLLPLPLRQTTTKILSAPIATICRAYTIRQ